MKKSKTNYKDTSKIKKMFKYKIKKKKERKKKSGKWKGKTRKKKSDLLYNS